MDEGKAIIGTYYTPVYGRDGHKLILPYESMATRDKEKVGDVIAGNILMAISYGLTSEGVAKLKDGIVYYKGEPQVMRGGTISIGDYNLQVYRILTAEEVLANGDKVRPPRVSCEGRDGKQRVGDFMGFVNHQDGYDGPQLARVKFDGNKTVSRVPISDIEVVSDDENK
jgi:hypothetical protein